MPASEFIELYRALREGVALKLEVYAEWLEELEAKGRPGVAARFRKSQEVYESQIMAIGERLAGKRGPGGGIEVDALLISLLVIAACLNAPRAKVALLALEVVMAESDASFGTCGLIGKPHFGPALEAILSDDALTKRVFTIEVAHDSGKVEIAYDPDGEELETSTFKIDSLDLDRVNDMLQPETRSSLKISPFVHIARITFVGLRRLRGLIKEQQPFRECA